MKRKIDRIRNDASPNGLKKRLDELYAVYNQQTHVHPDPIEYLYDYTNPMDREIVGLIAASLAYGRVMQILKSVSHVLCIMGPSPAVYLKNASPKALRREFADFVHRFATGENLMALLLGIKQVIKAHGSLYECFLNGFRKRDGSVLSALTQFVRNLTEFKSLTAGHLVPLPEKGSACKRLNLFMRWMVRKDAVDPGGWDEIPESKLIIPLDVHMYRAGLLLGFTKRKQADMRTALEVTAGFKEIVPQDPVRYDFAITRLGMRNAQDLDLFLKSE
jgi:uncharacterized protein (TIGR02757 family)